MTYTIEHKNKLLVTTHFTPLDPDTCQDLRDSYYRKPNWKDVKNNLQSIERGGTNVSAITDYYVKDLMAKVKLYSPRWSIEEVLESDELLGYFYSRIQASEKVYPKTQSLINNLETAFRISGGGVTMKPSNFPMKSADYILEKFNVNNIYYDYSCGWGVRLLSALKHRITYLGTDPNRILCERLQQMKKDYDNVNYLETFADIRAVGSEEQQVDWVGKVGLAFSSPPYFGLEDYKLGKQSYREGMDYSLWLNTFMQPTIKNIYEYLIPDGFFAINIKNYETFDLVSDTQELIKKQGFVYIESIELENRKRPSAKKNLNTNEQIYVYRKIA